MSQPTTPEENAALVRTTLEDFNAGDIDACVARLTPDLVMNFAELPEPLNGRDVWRRGVEMMRHAFPDLRMRVDDILAAQYRVALRLTCTATHSGEFRGFPATGRPVEYVSHEFCRIADGRIAEEWICSDTAGPFRQLG